MAQPRILIVGKNGQVGWELSRTLAPTGEVVAVDFPEINLASADSIRSQVLAARPSVIVNAAAYTQVDKAEAEPDLAMKINGEAPGVLAEEARKLGALLVHFSTDYVFDGAKTTPYEETDEPGPLGAYGRSKLAGDQAIEAVNPAHLIFRLCWVYGARGQNFLLTIMRLAREREQLRVVGDQLGCPTWSRMIAESVSQSLVRVLASGDLRFQNGVYHLAASGKASWHEFADRIVATMPPSEKKCAVVEAIPTSAYPTPASRPAYSVMCCEKLQRTFGVRLPDWKHSLGQVLETK
jgi:dTDP-4-dehydrorhamnose reductase